MTEPATGAVRYRWTRDEFVRAWEAGAFERRVELVEGEVWAVVIRPWHAETTGLVSRALPDGDIRVMMAPCRPVAPCRTPIVGCAGRAPLRWL